MKLFTRNILALVLAAALLCVPASASPAVGYSSGTADDSDTPIGASSLMQLEGYIQPTIMTITMPSKVNFDIQKATPKENKVLSPRILVKNNSNSPVNIMMEYASVDLSSLGLSEYYWSDNGIASDDKIGLGITKERVMNQAPTDLQYANWIANGYNYKSIMNVDSHNEGAMYVVGHLGKNIPESGTFRVSIRFIANLA